MDEDTDRYTIGDLAHRTGLPTRTVRFWSDSGVTSPAARSAGGYRLYDSDSINDHPPGPPAVRAFNGSPTRYARIEHPTCASRRNR